MSVDWRKLSREAGLDVSSDGLHISCGDRTQIVRVDDSAPDAIRIWSIVARGAETAQRPNAAVDLWKMNRFRELVGFKIAEKGRAVGEAWIPTIGLTAEEWRLHVVTVARACDRLEYLWTGRDIE